MGAILGPNGWEINDGAEWTEPSSNRRLRVDEGSTGFYAGREFRTFKELSIAAAATYVLRYVSPINVILTGIELTIDNGQVRAASVVGGTPGGAFAEVLPVLARNSMTERPLPLYAPQVVWTAGGTLTGGTELDVVRLKVENASAAASSVGNREQDERGLGPATIYIRIQNIGVGLLEGTFNARWEERP
jgi:hypothetical protein